MGAGSEAEVGVEVRRKWGADLQLGGFPVLLLLAVPQCEQTLLQRLHAALQPLLGGARGG